MIGFIIINDSSIKLCQLRKQILEQLDDQQLEIIGINFKFLKKSFPVSSKQETFISIQKISVHLNTKIDTNDNSINLDLETQSKQNSFCLQPANEHQQNHSFGSNSEILKQLKFSSNGSTVTNSSYFYTLIHH